MAQYYDALNSYEEKFNDPDMPTVVYCKRYRDMVSDRVCILRSRCMPSRNEASCTACIMSIALGRSVC